MYKVFIDGKAGTTGLRIYERLNTMDGIELITLSDDKRKDINYRKDAINKSDISFLCLPDAAAIEAVSLVENKDVRIIDTSTAHRTNDDWTYGFAELSKNHFDNIKNSKRVANPGCHASGFISLIYPLVKNNLLLNDAPLSCTSLTGYSGGGNKMIAEYEGENRDTLLDAPRIYGISQTHKHLKEMKEISNLTKEPVFFPIVAPYYSGMLVTVPITKENLTSGTTMDDIKAVYKSLYNDKIVFYKEDDESGFLSANKYSGKDSMEISVFGNKDRIILASRFDNLGKGASGSAIECMNIMLGRDKTLGLDL
jgi:N-acetyl-gamma-glutamyl-phosphate reductase